MISGKPAKGAAFDVDGYELAMQNYELVNRSLLATPVRPGFVWDRKRKRMVLRGEFANVPKRFLDLSERSEGYGNVDDRAQEFTAIGIIDGDDLVRWMETAVRPVKKAFVFRYDHYPSGIRVRRLRARAVLAGRCMVCGRAKDRARKHLKTCYWCNAKAAERVARSREAKRLTTSVIVEF